MKHMYIRCDVSGGLVVAASSLTIASETYHAGHGGVEGIAERDSVLCIRQVIFGGIPVQPRIIRVVEDYSLDSPLREQTSQGGSNLLASSRAGVIS